MVVTPQFSLELSIREVNGALPAAAQGAAMTRLVTDEVDRAGRPSTAADGLSVTTGSASTLLAEHAPALMKAD